MQRSNRHKRKPPKRTTTNCDTAIKTLSLFNDYRNLPLNYMHALLDYKGSLRSYGAYCTNLFDNGLLDRVAMRGTTFEMMTYSRTDCGRKDHSKSCCGTHFLQWHGHPCYAYNNKAQDAEQTIIDIALAQIELALRASPDVSLFKWHDYLEIRDVPDRSHRFSLGKNPNTGKDMYLVPDGNPFLLGASVPNSTDVETIFFLMEVVRFNNSAAVLRHKIRSYRMLEQHIKQRYGTSALMILWIPTREKDKDDILHYIKEEYADKEFQCKWMLVHTITDHIKERLSTPPLTTLLGSSPWDRAYPTQFSLFHLKSVPRA